MGKLLVTGANGFLGARIVAAALRAGEQVRAFTRPGRAEHCAGAEIFSGDLGDENSLWAAMEGVDRVIHSAARVATTGSWEEFVEANVRGTHRVIQAARAAGVTSIVHISSLSVYAVDRDGITITEDSPYESEADGRGMYSRSKLAADRLALYEARQGAPVVVLRPGLLYGPGKRPPLARQSFNARGFKLILARPGYLLPMTHVDNVADAALLAANCRDAIGKAFTIVDQNVRQDEYTKLYRAAAGATWRPVYLPVAAVALAAGIVERGLRLARRRSPVTAHQIRRATDSAFFDCTRAHTILGWQPRIDLQQGLRDSFASVGASA